MDNKDQILIHMQIISFIPSFFISLFVLFKLVKDDHVFLRKNIKLEEIFDIVFIATILGIIFAQFASAKNSFSLPQGVIGGALGLLLIGKYRKLPLGRLFDFFTLSFLTSLPVGFLIAALFSKKTQLILYFFGAFVYFLLAVFSTKNLLSRTMNRTLKEGSLSIYILMFFSLFSLLMPVFGAIKWHLNFFNPENISLIILFVISLILLVKQNTTRTQLKHEY